MPCWRRYASGRTAGPGWRLPSGAGARGLLRRLSKLFKLRHLSALDLGPGHPAAGQGSVQPLPELAVLHRLALLGLPAAAAPALDPAAGAIAQVVRAGVDGDGDPGRQALQG